MECFKPLQMTNFLEWFFKTTQKINGKEYS